MIGSRLGPYEITAPIGAGGMGEVYRGRDAALNREVAIKVLPATLASDPERLARFKREAQVLASLNHPNIAHVYGFEGAAVADGSTVHFLAMELVEGEDLAERLKRGAIPVDEAIAIAKQIAEGLEEAHEHGIIHRDLKPANIKVTPDGKVKVLDFGLAKAMEGDPASSAVNSQLSNSPTMSRHMTEAGMIMGTAAYMSPEQARGKPVDKRADIWSFGVVLFEMLTGMRLFAGETVSDTLAAVLKEEAPWARLPKDTPPRVGELLRRCLARDPRQRTRDIGEARLVLENPRGGEIPTAPPAARTRPRGEVILPWVIAAALVIALVAVTRKDRATAPVENARLEVSLGVEGSREPTGRTIAITRDGSTIAFVGRGDGVERVYIRRLDDLSPVPLAGTEGATHPFFSPDGKWIGFFTPDSLKKVAVQGGEVVTLAKAPIGRGGSWGEDGNIYFTATVRQGVSSVSSGGGAVTIVTDPTRQGSVTDRWPQILPGGKSLLLTTHANNWFYEDAKIVAASIETGERRVVVAKGYFGRYVPSGHLIYMSGGRVYAAPFDLDSLSTTGPALPFLDGVDSNQSSGATALAFADDGALVYVPGTSRGNEGSMSWMDRSGRITPLRATPADWRHPQFSSDGRRIVMAIHDGRSANIWSYDWARDALSRITYETGDQPALTPDGARVSFMFDSRQLAAVGGPGEAAPRPSRVPPDGIYWTRTDGTGPMELLAKGTFEVIGASSGQQSSFLYNGKSTWHPNGRTLAFVSVPGETPERAGTGGSADISVLELTRDTKGHWTPGEVRPLVATPFVEQDPAFSPDGRFFAYTSNESGQSQVYVRPFPSADRKWQVSTDSADFPQWSLARPELTYFDPKENRVMVAPYTVTDGSFEPGKPRPWSNTAILRPAIGAPYALHPDGERMVVRGAANEAAEHRNLSAVLWLDGFGALRRLSEQAARR